MLLSTSVFAQSADEAEKLYGDGELQAAMKSADAALKGATAAGEIAKLHVVRSLVFLAQNKKDKAKAAFTQALQADAATQLDAQRVPPTAVQLFEQAREALPPGSVTVSAESEATLRVDGVDFGPLPLTSRISVGRHTLEATDGKGEVMRAEVVVRSGEAQTVKLARAVATPPVVAAAPVGEPPPAPSPEPSVGSTSATLLDGPRPQVKQTFWGLIPIVVAAGAGWMTPPLAGSFGYAGLGVPLMILTSAAVGLGVGLFAASAAAVELSQGEAHMNWWGLIPLGLGLVAFTVSFSTWPVVAGLTTDNVFIFNVSAPFAIVGLGIGSGMLVGRVIGLGAAAPKVSFYVDPQGGGGLSVAGRF
ncbi:MAG: hypothetical protein QM817_01690 [Archangium sp.]